MHVHITLDLELTDSTKSKYQYAGMTRSPKGPEGVQCSVSAMILAITTSTSWISLGVKSDISLIVFLIGFSPAVTHQSGSD